MAKKKAPKADLGEFEGSPVVGAQLILKRTGDGLSASMRLDPVKLHVGEIITFAGEAEVAAVRHDAADEETDDLIRVHIANASVIKIIDAEVLGTVLDEHRERVRAAEQDAKDAEAFARGEQKLPTEGTIKVNEGAGVPTDDEIAEAERRERKSLRGPTAVVDIAKKVAAQAARKGGAS